MVDTRSSYDKRIGRQKQEGGEGCGVINTTKVRKGEEGIKLQREAGWGAVQEGA